VTLAGDRRGSLVSALLITCDTAMAVALIATMFHLRVGITTAWQAMRRLGYTPQLPIHRAIERDEAAIAHWRRYQWPAVKESPPDRPPGSCLPTSAARR
jgi:putative transposase